MRIPFQIFIIIMLFSLMTFAILNIDIIYGYQIFSLCLSGCFICLIQRQLNKRKQTQEDLI